MQNTRRTAVTIGLAAICAAGLNAQTQETKTTTETKVEIKGGKDVVVIGCVERRPNGDFMLTEVRENRKQDTPKYMLVTSENLTKHLGERVEVTGKSTANGDGKLSVESKIKTEVENGKEQETKTKTESKSGALDVPFLGVVSMRTLSASCN